MTSSLHDSSTFWINETAHPWQADVTVETALHLQQELAAHPVATALNGTFVPKTQRASTPIQAGDHLTVFQPIVGG